MHVMSFLIFHFNLFQQILILLKNQSSILLKILPAHKTKENLKTIISHRSQYTTLKTV